MWRSQYPWNVQNRRKLLPRNNFPWVRLFPLASAGEPTCNTAAFPSLITSSGSLNLCAHSFSSLLVITKCTFDLSILQAWLTLSSSYRIFLFKNFSFYGFTKHVYMWQATARSSVQFKTLGKYLHFSMNDNVVHIYWVFTRCQEFR